jgi:predicted RND superfamily exporter protein
MAIRDSLAEVMRPVLLSNVTTAVGFASLTVSDMEPVVEFGTFVAIGILLSFIFNICLIPGILRTFQRAAPQPRLTVPHWTASIGRTVARHKRPVLALAVGTFVLSIVLTARAGVESNVLRFFPEDSKVRRDYDFIGEKLTGFYTMELDASIESSQGPALLKALDAMGERIAARPEVAKTVNYRTLATCFSEVPRPALMPSQSVRRNPLKTMLRTYRHREGDVLSLRLSVLVRAMSSNDFTRLTEFIEQQADEMLPDSATYYLTGVASLSKASEQSLIDTQIRSLSIAVCLILLLIALFMRSLRALVVAILPNLLPIFSVFGIMGLLGIPFDTATVMIASIAIGIAADDTIHFLAHYREEKFLGFNTLDAVGNSLEKAGRAITYTSIVASAGFIILLLAEFQPIQYFGLFTAIIMIAAWAGDVFVLPACVACLHIWERRTAEIKAGPVTNDGSRISDIDAAP